MSFERQLVGRPDARGEAPGRVNLIGEHTDYNAGLVLPLPLPLRTRASLRLRSDAWVVGVSRESGRARAPLGAPPAGVWLDYVRGTALALAEAGRAGSRGFDVYVESDVPAGAGLSSSAALEVAVARALASAWGAPFGADEGLELARLCRRAEADFVGVPCGLMDQAAAACAPPDHALLLDCRVEHARAIALPREGAVLVIDTEVRRELRSGGYAERRAECDRALLAARAALDRPLASLSEATAAELPGLQAALEPLLFRRLRHVVRENARVIACAAALERGDLVAAGAALAASHASLRDDFQVSWDAADRLVEASGSIPGLLGARMTGGGWGGCTVHLAEAGRARAAAKALLGAVGGAARLVASL